MEFRRGSMTAKREAGHPYQIHAYHADYTKPLEVEWLCRKCNRLQDRNGGDQRAALL